MVVVDKEIFSRNIDKSLKRRRGIISQGTFDIITRALIIFLCIYITRQCAPQIFEKEFRTSMINEGMKALRVVTQGLVKIDDGIAGSISRIKIEGQDMWMNKTAAAIFGNGEDEGEKKDEKKDDADDKKDNIMEMVARENDNARKTALSENDSEQGNQKENVTTKTENGGKNNEDNKSDGEKSASGKNVKDKAVQAAVTGKTIVPMPKLKGVKFNAANLGGFYNVIKKYYTVTSATSIKESDLNIEQALKMNFNIKGKNDKPQILIYHTHSQEDFSNTNGDKNKTIVQVGDYLAKILTEQFGYNVIHDKSTYDLVNGKLDRNVAYDQAREGVSAILKDNPSINLVLDIHRDGLNRNVHLLTEINGKKTAQIMFFNGMSRFKDSGDIDYLYNPHLKENLALSLQMKLNAENYYPGFTRNNYLNAYQYNLDLCEKAMLIEMGAQTNTFEEVRNAAEPLAMLIHLTMGS